MVRCGRVGIVRLSGGHLQRLLLRVRRGVLAGRFQELRRVKKVRREVPCLLRSDARHRVRDARARHEGLRHVSFRRRGSQVLRRHRR